MVYIGYLWPIFGIYGLYLVSIAIAYTSIWYLWPILAQTNFVMCYYFMSFSAFNTLVTFRTLIHDLKSVTCSLSLLNESECLIII